MFSSSLFNLVFKLRKCYSTSPVSLFCVDTVWLNRKQRSVTDCEYEPQSELSLGFSQRGNISSSTPELFTEGNTVHL